MVKAETACSQYTSVEAKTAPTKTKTREYLKQYFNKSGEDLDQDQTRNGEYEDQDPKNIKEFGHQDLNKKRKYQTRPRLEYQDQELKKTEAVKTQTLTRPKDQDRLECTETETLFILENIKTMTNERILTMLLM